jgi:hypothetical protein
MVKAIFFGDGWISCHVLLKKEKGGWLGSSKNNGFCLIFSSTS